MPGYGNPVCSEDLEFILDEIFIVHSRRERQLSVKLLCGTTVFCVQSGGQRGAQDTCLHWPLGGWGERGASDLFLPPFAEGTDAGSVLSKDSQKQGGRTESPSFQSGFFILQSCGKVDFLDTYRQMSSTDRGKEQDAINDVT